MRRGWRIAVVAVAGLALVGAGWRHFGRSAHDGELIRAVARRDIEGMRLALDHGASPDARESRLSRSGANPVAWMLDRSEPRTALGIAAFNLDAAAMNLLLAAGANPNLTYGYSRTALIDAAANPVDSEPVRVLLDSGAQIRHQATNGNNALGQAASGNIATVRLLLARGADPSTVGRCWQDTPLMNAVDANRADIVKVLLAAGAQTATRDSFGKTALMRATAAGKKDVAALLRAAGARR